jgi:hypothetical protein
VATVVSGADGEVDGVQEDMADSGSWSRCWIASFSEEEVRPEWSWAAVSFGSG